MHGFKGSEVACPTASSTAVGQRQDATRSAGSSIAKEAVRHFGRHQEFASDKGHAIFVMSLSGENFFDRTRQADASGGKGPKKLSTASMRPVRPRRIR